MAVAWNEIKSEIKKEIPVHSYRMWIEPIDFIEEQNQQLVLSCPNNFSKRRVLDQYQGVILTAIERVAGKHVDLSFQVVPSNGSDSSKRIHDLQLPLPKLNGKPHSGRLLRKDFTFDQFVVGGSNDYAYSASLALASNRNSSQPSLFLLAGTGLGKSHLTQAVGHHILTEQPGTRVYYITAEDFTNEMVHALRHGSIDQFKGKFRKRCDVLLLEDIQFLSGKERTQLELALTLDALIDSGKKIIFSSCYLPSDIPKLSDELCSRLQCGLISNIDPPDFGMRIRILKKKTEKNGYPIPDDVIQYLAGELTENIRQLESGLIGVAAKSSLLGAPVDLRLAESVAKNIVRRNKAITIDSIKKLVCKHSRISIEDLVSRSRKQAVVRPRQIAIYLARKYTDQSLQAIGKSFYRYHATALHAIACVERCVREDNQMKRYIEFLCQRLESGNF